MTSVPTPERFETASGARIYALTLPVFAGVEVHAYVLIDGEYVALIDTGPPFPGSLAALEAGMNAVREHWHEPLADWGSLSRIILTHAHFDHHGGLPWVRQRSSAPVAVHPIDRPVVEDPVTALAEEKTALDRLLLTAGMTPEALADMVRLPQGSVPGLPAIPVQDLLEEGQRFDDRFDVIHVPGHGSGQVALRMGEVLICADQVMARTNPRLVPRSFDGHGGLGVYLESLERLEALEGVELVLPGHDEAMLWPAFRARIEALREGHRQRLEQVRTLCQTEEGRTVAELTGTLYPTTPHPGLLPLQFQSVATWVEHLEAAGALTRSADEVPRFRAV